MSDSFEKLAITWREAADLGSAAAVLQWDQETQMPGKGATGRGQLLATLAGLRHRALCAPALLEAVAACEAEAETGSDLAAQVKHAKRATDRATRVPERLAREIAEATSAGLVSWQEARKQADFSLFVADLEKIIALKKEEAAAVSPDQPTYDVLLDEYEEGATQAELQPLLDDLCEDLAPLVAAAADHPVDESPVLGDFAPAAQEEFGRFCASAMGYDFEAGRLDQAAHPFCTGFGAGDVRITWRYQSDDFRPALFGILHEAGHAIYEQNLPSAWHGTPMGPAVSLGIHESQSRLWENLVGRSRSFWEWALPHFQKHFPGTLAGGVDALWPALHGVKPSLIRVEADEATYNLHVAIRFDVERRLFADEFAVADLPEVWDAAYQKFLGVHAPDVSDGVLQDIHWSMGAFGYFPTYTLGNLVASQLFEAAQEQLGDLDASFAQGEFAPLRTWLTENIHRHGSRYTPGELVEQATGKPLSSDALLRHLRATTEAACQA